MKKGSILIVWFFIATIFVACKKDLLLDPADGSSVMSESDASTIGLMDSTNTNMCGMSSYTLWAGQTINAGTLVIANDQTNLYVNYTTTGTFQTLHLWVGTDLSLLPMISQGTPIPGHFPYVYDASGLTSYMFTIPLATIPFYNACGNTIYVVAHAEVMINGGHETAFGGDLTDNNTNRWFYYAAFKTGCCTEPPPPVSIEKLGTAFAKGDWVFTTDKKSNPENLPSLKLTNNRWEWAINMMSPSSKSYDLWVGAGLNYTSKGKLVGSVTVNYTGSQVIVTFNMFNGYTIEESHIYANDMKPTMLAPGRYGNTFYFHPTISTFTTTIDVMDSNMDGIWLIIHAIVWGPKIVNI